VYVDSRHRPYSWTLTRPGARGAAARGSSRGYALRIRLPGAGAGLYVLAVRSGTNTTSVPLIASAARGSRGAARPILVVLPALTWQGSNQVDDEGDGIPNTLENGGPVVLRRPLANGLPPGFADEAALLSYLDSAHLPYDLTSDLGLVDGSGPQIAPHKAVVFAGSERWLTPTLGSSLRAYVQGGGRVLSVGLASMRRGVSVSNGKASAPSAPAASDALGARPGALVNHNTQLLLVIRDRLGIFSTTSGALAGYATFEPFTGVAPPAHIVSEAGTSESAASIIGYALGRGTVIDIALAGFGASLGHDADAQELIRRSWTVLSR